MWKCGTVAPHTLSCHQHVDLPELLCSCTRWSACPSLHVILQQRLTLSMSRRPIYPSCLQQWVMTSGDCITLCAHNCESLQIILPLLSWGSVCGKKFLHIGFDTMNSGTSRLRLCQCHHTSSRQLDDTRLSCHYQMVFAGRLVTSPFTLHAPTIAKLMSRLLLCSGLLQIGSNQVSISAAHSSKILFNFTFRITREIHP